jgi:hypothetical protein
MYPPTLGWLHCSDIVGSTKLVRNFGSGRERPQCIVNTSVRLAIICALRMGAPTWAGRVRVPPRSGVWNRSTRVLSAAAFAWG